MRNLSIGALVAIVGLATGVGTTASAAPIGNLAPAPALSENNIIVLAARRGGHRGGTVYRGRTVHRGVTVHRGATVRRGGVVYRGGGYYGTSPYCGYYPYPPCYSGGGLQRRNRVPGQNRASRCHCSQRKQSPRQPSPRRGSAEITQPHSLRVAAWPMLGRDDRRNARHHRSGRGRANILLGDMRRRASVKRIKQLGL